MKPPLPVMLAALWIVLAAGCMFGELKKELEEQKISFGLKGRVEGIARAQGHVFVLLYEKQEKNLRLIRYALPDDTGIFSFIVTPGIYLLAGVDDLNGNQRHDPGEPTGAWGAPDEIVVTVGEATESQPKNLARLNLTLAPGQFPLVGAETSVNSVNEMPAALIKMGQQARWDDPMFDDEQGITGLWKPMTFLKQHGAGVYFMEPFDRKKIPVLFVHGSGGTPRPFQALAENLDSEHFQPWVVYYPSGMRLNQIATGLNNIVKQLQLDYGFEQMGVVAHSMGGLVARAFILKHLIEDGLGTVRAFVSISSPWGGVAMAAKGVEKAPQAVPSWHDVAPQSDFIEALFADPLTPQVPYYLLFSFLGDCSIFMANNDGVVEVASQLDLRAQNDALRIRGLNETHVDILSSEATIAFVNEALAASFLQR
jgi:pimeloyl-ACP methyl ester carboxylesterase